MKGVKIGIIGVGHVGAHVMYSIALQGLADEILIVDTDEKDEKGELISAYVIMRFVDKDGEVLLENLPEKEEEVIYDYYDKLCDELYGDDEESED